MWFYKDFIGSFCWVQYIWYSNQTYFLVKYYSVIYRLLINGDSNKIKQNRCVKPSCEDSGSVLLRWGCRGPAAPPAWPCSSRRRTRSPDAPSSLWSEAATNRRESANRYSDHNYCRHFRSSSQYWVTCCTGFDISIFKGEQKWMQINKLLGSACRGGCRLPSGG